VKFTKSDIRDLNSFNNEQSGFTKEEVEFLKNLKIEIKELSSRWAWIDINPNLREDFFNEVIYPKFNYIPNAKDIREIGYRSFLRKFREYGGVWTKIKGAVKNITSKFITKKQYPRSINYLSFSLKYSSRRLLSPRN